MASQFWFWLLSGIAIGMLVVIFIRWLGRQLSAKGKHESNTGFAEYARRRYPKTDEDTITMIEDILEHPPKG